MPSSTNATLLGWYTAPSKRRAIRPVSRSHWTTVGPGLPSPETGRPVRTPASRARPGNWGQLPRPLRHRLDRRSGNPLRRAVDGAVSAVPDLSATAATDRVRNGAGFPKTIRRHPLSGRSPLLGHPVASRRVPLRLCRGHWTVDSLGPTRTQGGTFTTDLRNSISVAETRLIATAETALAFHVLIDNPSAGRGSLTQLPSGSRTRGWSPSRQCWCWPPSRTARLSSRSCRRRTSRRVYMAGIGNFDPITGVPVTAPGTFRLN